ncbi:MAG: hypothetical protein CMH30_00390 [Micavibrio sp.]|nr:hypothetical protein [Micavibrio sp.]
MKMILKKLFIILAFTTLSACTVIPDPAGQPQAQLTFAHMNKLALLVEKINIIDRNNAMGDVTDDKSLYFTTSPAKAMKNYLGNRFMADGGYETGTLEFTIEEATLPYKRVASEFKIMSAMKLDEKEEYTVNYRVKIVLKDNMGQERIKTTMRYTKSREFNRSLSIAALETAYLAFIEEAITEMDKGLVQSLGDNFKLISPNQPDPMQMNRGFDTPESSSKVYNGQIDNSDGYFEQLNPQPLIAPTASSSDTAIQTEDLPAASSPMPLQ